MHRVYKNKPLSSRQKLANQLISKKRYIVEQCFGTTQTLIQNGTRQLLRYGKSQRPSHTEKYLHESEKSSQQNLRRSIIKETLIKSQELVKYEVDRNHCKGAH